MNKNTPLPNTHSPNETPNKGDDTLAISPKSNSAARRYIKIACLGFLGIFLSITLLLTFILTLIFSSQNTREWFVTDLSPVLLSLADIELHIDNFHSPQFGYWYFENLRLDSNEEVLFDANKLLLHFDASSLLERKVDIHELSATKLLVSIPEATSSAQTNNESLEEGWQNRLFPIRIQKLDFKHIDVIQAQLNIPIFQLNGNAALLWQDNIFISDLLLTSNAQLETHIDLQAAINNQLTGNISAKIKEPAGGWLGGLIHLPDTQALDFIIALNAHNRDKRVNWELQSFNTPWQQHKISASGKGYWEREREKLNLSQLSFLIDGNEHNITGWWQENTFNLNANLDNFPIDLTAPFQDYLEGGFLSGSVSATGDTKSPHIKTNLTASSQYKDESVFADLTAEGNLQTLNIEQASIHLGKTKLKTSGDVFIEKQAFNLNIHQLSGPINIIETFDITLPEDLSIDINEATGQLSGPFTAPYYRGFVQAKGQYKQELFELESKFDGDINQIELTDFNATVSSSQIKADGLIDWDNETLSLKLDTHQVPLNLVSLFDIELPEQLTAKLNINGDLTGNFTNPAFKGKISSRGQYMQQPIAISLYAEGDKQDIQIEDLNAHFDTARLEASGNIKLKQETLDIDIKELSGPLRLVKMFEIDIPNELLVDIQIVDAGIEGPFSNLTYKADANINGTFDKQALKMETRLEGDFTKLELDYVILELSKGKLKTSGTVDWKNEQLNLAIETKNLPADLVAIAQIELPEELNAFIDIDGTVKGQFSLPYFNGQASVEGNFQDMYFDMATSLNSSADKIELENLTASFDIAPPVNNIDQQRNNQKRAEKTKAAVQANGVFTISSNEVEGKIKVQTLPYDVITLTGLTLPNTLSGDINADLSISGKLPLPMIYGSLNSSGQFEGRPFKLDVTGSQENKTLFFDNTRLSWNETVITANGEASRDKLDLHVNLSKLKLTDFNQFGYDLQPGTVDLEFDLLGSIASPDLSGIMQLTIENQNFTEDRETPQEDIIVTTTFMTENSYLSLKSNVEQGQESRGSVSIDSTYKPFLEWLLNESETQKITDLPLEVKTKGSVGLNWINHFIDRDIQSISGMLTLDTSLTGSINKPKIEGTLSLENGKYINSLSQTSIEDAKIKLIFDEKSIAITKAEATDGQQGTLNLKGDIFLPDSDDGKVDITLNVNKASLVRREDIEGEATGTISLAGDFKKVLLKGDIDVSPFQIMLDLIPNSSIPEIEVSLKEDDTSKQKKRIELPVTALNVKVNVEQQAYIRGRGLDAELKGNLSLTGTTSKPRYDGEFRVIRGTFELFARSFKLEEGDVLFSDEAVSLYVQGRHVGKDITFIASLSGTMDDLKIELRTIPSLPEDEALARLLFGKSVRNITPIQAIQLASAIQTLRGESGDFDPLGKARELLHVDSISVESQETSKGSGVAVGVGKYITEGVYVELSRTPEPTQPWKGSIEVELTPNINLETTAGGSSGFGGVELQWKNDY